MRKLFFFTLLSLMILGNTVHSTDKEVKISKKIKKEAKGSGLRAAVIYCLKAFKTHCTSFPKSKGDRLFFALLGIAGGVSGGSLYMPYERIKQQLVANVAAIIFGGPTGLIAYNSFWWPLFFVVTKTFQCDCCRP